MKHWKTYITLCICISVFFMSATIFAKTVANKTYAVQTQDIRLQRLLHDAPSPVAGNPNGAITLVEFLDFQCAHCIEMASVVTQLMAQNPSLRVVFKVFPIEGPISLFAARAALAANLQGKYLPFSKAMFANNQLLSEKYILTLAAALGINMQQLKHDMNSQNIINQIKQNYQLAVLLNLPGTPVFFVGKTNENNFNNLIYFPGGVSERTLQETINSF